MTRSCRGLSRRSNGSMVTRSVVRRCVVPEASAIGPRRETSVSNAVGQSSSVPSSSPIRCLVILTWLPQQNRGRWWASWARHDGQSCGTSWPQRSSSCRMPLPASNPAIGRVDSSAPVVSSHWPWPHTSTTRQPPAQPVEVVAVQVRDVVDRVVEVGGVAALAPGVPRRRVVVARQAEREREQVGALEREVQRVVRAHRGAQRDDLARPAAVGGDVRHHLVDDPRLVRAVAPGALLQRQLPGRPRAAVVRVDAVELHPAGVDQVGDGADHAVVLEVPGACPARTGTPAPAGRSGRRRPRCRPRRSPASTAPWRTRAASPSALAGAARSGTGRRRPASRCSCACRAPR